MIPVGKLARLSPRHRMRKAALVLSEIERGLLGHRGIEPEVSLFRYGLELSRLLLSDAVAGEAVRTAAAALAEACTPPAELAEAMPRLAAGSELARRVDSLRHALLAATGQAPGDWDLLDPCTGLPDPASRKLSLGKKVFLEDLRSPFNIGSIFRTADAFGVEELILSPACADPLHPRALRSAMGAIGLLSWRRAALESLETEVPVFALELGGTPIDEFSFPDKGIVVLGSEELGISLQARDRCSYGTVSIPMSGAKGSLNVAVAFGILIHAWIAFDGNSCHLYTYDH